MKLIASYYCLVALSSASFSAFSQNNIPYTVLTPAWRVLVGGNDYMTSVDINEQKNFPSSGAYMYIPTTNVGNTALMYRLYEGSSLPSDHKDSAALGQGIYSTDGPNGYPWSTSNAVPGLTQMFNVSNGHDNATVNSSESIAGYNSRVGLPFFGYARYNNNLTVLNTISAGGITVGSNSVAGGAIWSWKWNNTEFVSASDFGREIQSDLVYYDSNNLYHNPNEAGSQYSGGSLAPQNMQGSPNLLNINLTNQIQSTRSIPLEWSPQSFGGDSNHPVVYNSTIIGKDLNLNYANLGSVVQYVTVVESPSSLSGAQVEIPTGYLTSAFNSFYTYDAGSDSFTQVTPPNACTTGQSFELIPASGYGGVIISDAGGAHAMGVYGALTSAGGSVSYFTLFDFLNCSDATSKFAAVYGPGSINAGLNYYKSYIATGTLINVKNYMQQMYSMGAK